MSKKKGLGWAFSSHVTMQEQWDTFDDDEFFQFNVDWLREVCRVVKSNGNILVFGTFHNVYQLGFIQQSGLNRRVLKLDHLVQAQRAAQHHCAHADREH